MTTATFIDLAESKVAATSPIKTSNHNDEAACYLYFTPIPGTASIGIIHDNTSNKHKNMHTTHHNASLSAQNNKMTTPPTVPLEVAMAAAHPDGSFDMEEIDIVVSELGTHDELCIMNIFDREGHAFVLAPRVRKNDGDLFV